MTEFKWTAKRDQAAMLVAQDELTDAQIAADLGIARMTLARWKSAPEFQARVREHVKSWSEHVRQTGIAVRERRLAPLNDRWQRLMRLVEARAAAMKDEVPGGDTGLLVRVPVLLKVYHAGEDGQLTPTGQTERVYKYVLDTALLKEFREIERQAAQEVARAVEDAPPERQVLIREYVGINIEDV